MLLGKLIARILEYPLIYNIHSGVVNGDKVAAIKRIRPEFSGLRVLDLGCGPGTNTMLFRGADYTGVDTNERYIAVARKLFPWATFIVGDAATVNPPGGFDIVSINSLLHHMEDSLACRIITKAAASLNDGGIVILQEPLPPAPGDRVFRCLARLDRGRHFRSLAQWRQLVKNAGLRVEREELYRLRFLRYRMVSLALARCQLESKAF